MPVKKVATTKVIKKKAPAKEAAVKVAKGEDKKGIKGDIKREIDGDVKNEAGVNVAKKDEMKKEKKEVKTAGGAVEFSGKYFYAVGKRKTSIAQVRIYEVSKASKEVVNGKDMKAYFTIERHQDAVKAPLAAVGLTEKFDVSVKVNGGGVMSQSEATKLGIARALVVYDENLKKSLKDLGYLTRDARIVERKKPGKRKARRSPQWAKR